MATRTTDLRKRVVLVGVPVAIAVIALGAFLASRGTAREFERVSSRQLQSSVRRAAALLDQYLEERRNDVWMMAQTPDVVAAANRSTGEASRLGLATVTPADLEARYAGTTGLLAGASVGQFLRNVRDSSDVAQISIVDALGFLAVSTDTGVVFVQSVEDWWADVIDRGRYEAPPFRNDSAGTVLMELATEIRDPISGDALGAVRVLVDLARLSRLLTLGEQGLAANIEVVDSTGQIVLSRDISRVSTRSPELTSVPLTDQTNVVSLPSMRNVLAASSPANDGRWWIVVRQRQDAAFNAARSIQDTVYLASGLALALALFLLVWLTEWLHRRVTQPVRLAGTVAGRIADGDLSVSVTRRTGGAEEVQRLLESFGRMVEALRLLVGEIRLAANESAAMAEEISASTEEMSASTQQMADTCQDLTSQANDQAELTRKSAGDADRILGIARSLAEGAKVAAERSTALVDTAGEHRDRLISGSEQLAAVAGDLEQGAADAHRLAGLSEEIQKFVTQAKAISSQTNMLALNAAIEASRATGGEGRGFAVVADEVRKLANQTARSAATTGEVVRNVLATVEETRDRLGRLAEASSSVRQVAESAASALEEVAAATAESSAWSDEIARAADEANQLVSDISDRLQTIAQGTESVVAASEQIAASAEEQSASTEQVAASASQLADASERLTSAVSSFRLRGGEDSAQEGQTDWTRSQSGTEA
jgi:methyl-accepting chemotaxis protein